MEWVKTTAKTLPEAIDLALDNLGVDEAEAEIVVVEEPRQGLFGRTRGTARVEARVKPKPAPPKNDRSRNKRNRPEGGGKNRNDRNKNRSKNRNSGSNSGENAGGNNGGDNKGRGRSQKDDRAKSGAARNPKRNDGAGGGTERSADQENRPRRSKPQGSGRSNGQRSGRSNERGNGNDQNTKPKEESPVEDVAEHLETFLTGLTEAFGFDDGVTINNSEADVLVGQIVGQHGLLVGPKGRTLDAIQELARISCQRAVPSSVRIKVDVGGYRQKRVEALGEFARKAADTAVADQVEVALEPMSPADRKAVHDAISEDPRVETRSVGSEPRRKVLVIPVADNDADADDSEEDAVAVAGNGDAASDPVQESVPDEVSEDVAAGQAAGDGSEEE